MGCKYFAKETHTATAGAPEQKVPDEDSDSPEGGGVIMIDDTI